MFPQSMQGRKIHASGLPIRWPFNSNTVRISAAPRFRSGRSRPLPIPWQSIAEFSGVLGALGDTNRALLRRILLADYRDFFDGLKRRLGSADLAGEALQ